MGRLWVAVVLVAFSGLVTSARTVDDQVELRRLFEEWVAARNANDTARMRPLFDDQMDQVQLASGVSHDREGMLRWFDEAFRGAGKGITVRVAKQNVRVLSADAGIIDTVVEFLPPNGGEVAGRSYITFVCTKRTGEWRVGAVRFAPTTVNKQ